MKCPKHPERECAKDRTRCQECLDKLRDYQTARRKSLLGSNHCVGTVTRSKCQNAPRAGKTMCQECADVFNKYQKERKKARQNDGNV